MTRSSSLTARLAVVSFLIGLVNATCYYPDGSSDSGHFACSSGSASNCCSEGFQCLSNGFCGDPRYDNYRRVLRGGCTDKSWGSGCQQTCTSLWPSGDESIHYCGSGKACCGRSDDCCSDSSVTKFDFGSPTVIAIAGESVAQEPSTEEKAQTTTQQQQEQQTQAPASSTREEQQQTQQATSTNQGESAPSTTKTSDSQTSRTNEPTSSSKNVPSSSSLISSSDSALPSKSDDASSSPATVTLISDRTRTYASTLTNAASDPSATQNVTNNYISSNNNNNTTNNTVVIAVGVGVGLLVLLIIIALAACWWLRKKRRRQQPNVRAQAVIGQGDVGTEYFEIEGSEAAKEMSAGGGVGLTKKGRWGRGSGVVFEMEGSRGIELDSKGNENVYGKT
ncbi:hypothetical protein K458DRAFT_418908 [Lentithecium fluviatile CBS 122367]|uniref:Mid2 domain-containing protein n=1 Tax=Lentithecium fluviatile CBS 122367 TaxID=1168545 RepID=A0A6G1IYE4_9PLEO|nr:hypothetical protein K458DRAFT_418908 [Lentithecium fluviatile CBS 122367]